MHVRAAAALPSVDVVSGSAFAARAREAHLKHERALKWKHDLAGFRAGMQVGVNADTLQMMVGRAQPVYTHIPGRAPAPPIAIAMGIALDAGDPGSGVTSGVTSGIAVDVGDPGSPDAAGPVEVAVPMKRCAAASSSSATTPMPPLNQACEEFKRELGVGGANVADIVDAACEVLGISDTEGLSLMEKAQKCWTDLKG